jgi:hypothetical protein
MMAPAVLITLGVLFMIDQFHGRSFWSLSPVLLIVIGLVKVLQYSASTEGHIPPGYLAPGYVPQTPVITPPPVPPAGNLPASTTDSQPSSSAQGYEENRNG